MDMTDLPQPLFPIHIGAGGTYWAAKGDTKWSAVRVLKVLRVRAEVERVIPRNGNVIHRKGKVRLDELVKRDPKRKGKDKPKAPPAEVFESVRAARIQEKHAVPATSEPIPEPEPKPEPPRPPGKRLSSEEVDKLFELVNDDSTDDDW